jgi:FlaA1/EpsC-like NDP-sugar epimerase
VTTFLNIEAILGRPEHPPEIETPLRELQRHRVLVTGADGSIGSAITMLLNDSGVSTVGTDVSDCDVTNRGMLADVMESIKPTLVFHLAGAKHAPDGEIDPLDAATINITGTANVVCSTSARVVTASTCKSCDPETAYGATKLVAERITLNAGGSVARFYNVPESSGNVFEIWKALPESDPIPVTICERYFVSLNEALSLLLWAAVLSPGRYAIAPGPPRDMISVASALYPDRVQVRMPRRRGDRMDEPLHAASETLHTTIVPNIVRIESPHDPEAA